MEDLANFAAQVAEVPRGSQRLIFKGSLFLVRFTYNPIHLLCIRGSTLFILIKILGLQPRDSALMFYGKILIIETLRYPDIGVRVRVVYPYTKNVHVRDYFD